MAITLVPATWAGFAAIICKHPAALGVRVFPGERRRDAGRTAFGSTWRLVACATTVLAWHLLLRSTLEASHAGVGQTVHALLYPVFDVVIFFASVTAAAAPSARRHAAPAQAPRAERSPHHDGRRHAQHDRTRRSRRWSRTGPTRSTRSSEWLIAAGRMDADTPRAQARGRHFARGPGTTRWR